MVNLLNPYSLLATFEVAGVFGVLFAETGLFIGFFLPGDTLLFTAGLLAATPVTTAAHLSLPAVLVAAVAGSVSGAQTGYWIGRRVGPALVNRPDRPRVQAAVIRTRAALDRYGTAKAIVLARFIPLMRTVCNPLAGTLSVPIRTFTLWQIVGGVVWTVGVSLAGYGLGSRIPHVATYLLPITLVIGVVSLIPIGLPLLRSARTRTIQPSRADSAEQTRLSEHSAPIQRRAA